MKNLRVGHYTNTDKGTGVTVFIFDERAEGVYHLCGSAPASHELHVLELEGNVSHADGLIFLGGSAYGLGAIQGVMEWFKEQHKGFPTTYGPIPILPAASIYDLGVSQPLPPTAEEAYAACASAREFNFAEGRVGAGTGASVGKLIPDTQCMSGGIGFSEKQLANGLTVLAFAVVNALGDIREKNNSIIAGARLPNGDFADCEAYMLTGKEEANDLFVDENLNTTLVAVFTNAKFSKSALKRISKMAIAGMARAIFPVFTQFDGDLLFSFSLGEEIASELTVGTMAAEAVREAIVNSVKDSVIL